MEEWGEGDEILHNRFSWQKHFSFFFKFKSNETEDFQRDGFQFFLLHFLLQESPSLHSAIKTTLYYVPIGIQTNLDVNVIVT